MRRPGTPERFPRSRNVLERFTMRYEPQPNGCWKWIGLTAKGGYGVFTVNNKRAFAHRWSHEHFIGPIPEGYEVDHVRARGCTGPACVNPAHLEAVTPAENKRRARRSHCPVGHPYDETNTYVRPDSFRDCRICINRRSVERNRRRKARTGTVDQAERTHCPQDHPYDAENTYVDKRGSRHCKECSRMRSRERQRRLRREAAA